jgi:uroporphyrinogen decarboxylase
MQPPPFEPDFERVRLALLGPGEPDHLPMVEFTVWPGHKARILGHPVRSMADEVAFARLVGYDHVPFNVGLQTTPQLLAAMEGRRYEVDRAGSQTGAGGEETVERRWAAGGAAAIADDADFERFDWPDPDEFDYGLLEEAEAVVPPSMKVVVQIGKIFNPVWWLMGFETFSMALYDNPDLIRRMFDRVGAIQLRALERALDYPCVGAYLHADDVAFNTSLMVSPEVLRRYAFPWFRRLVDLAHQAGVLAIYHSDGKLDAVLEDIIGLGFDGLHPIDPMGMDIAATKRRVAGRVGLLGNIDLRYTLTQGTPAEVEAEVRQRIWDLAPGGGYCLSSANSIPDYVPLENYLAMRRAWLRHGRYPIGSG